MENSKAKIFKSGRNYLILSIVFALLAISLYSYFFIIVRKTEQSNAILEQEAKRLAGEESKIIELRNNVKNAEESKNQIASYFIDSIDIVPFLEAVEGYGSSTGVKVTYNSVDLGKDPARLNLEVDAEGNFSNLYKFINLLEIAPYEIVINSSTIDVLPPEVAVEKGQPLPPTVWKSKIKLSVLSITGVN